MERAVPEGYDLVLCADYRDVDSWGLAGCQGKPWCATYQFWLEAKIFGTDTALKHFHMDRKNYTAYNCFCIYEAFSRAGMVSDKPGTGSLVVFRHGHIGRVTKVQGDRVYTNEGNTSALYGDSNGGTLTAIAEGILAAGGYYKGNIDAVFGNGMELAVREFQEERDLEADGIIGRDTWTALFGRNS